MDSFKKLAARGLDSSNSTVTTLTIVVVCLLFVSMLLIAALLVLRRKHRQRQQQAKRNSLPQYQEIDRSGHNGSLTIKTEKGRSSVIIFRDGQPMLANPQSPPHSLDNVPEIHITFPDEEHDNGKRKSGRVMIVRVGDGETVGMEPLHDDEQLPAYEKESGAAFYSVDIEKIGGLKEKEYC